MAFQSLVAFSANLPGDVLGWLINNLIPAVLWLIIGIIAGLVTYRVIDEILLKTNVDRWIGLKKAKFKTSVVISTIAKWMIYLVFIGQAGEALNLIFVTDAIAAVLAFLPELAVAVVVFIAGYVLARYAEMLIRGAGGDYSDLTSKIMFFFAIYVTLAIALQQITFVDFALLSNILLIIVGSLGLGLALAMGLGLKEAVEDVALDYETKVMKHMKK